VAYPVLTDEALTPESQRDNCYISAEGNAGTHRVCPEALKVATLPLDYHSLCWQPTDGNPNCVQGVTKLNYLVYNISYEGDKDLNIKAVILSKY
jgi:hypothetical protein